MTVMLESPGVFALIAAGGFILCRVAADEAEVLTLAVLPEARRRGVGGALLTSALALALAWGVRTFFLEVAEDNPAALALYQGAGFGPIGRRPGYYRRASGSVAAIVLSRRLEERLNPSPP